jgi:hypothetical protein
LHTQARGLGKEMDADLSVLTRERFFEIGS